MRVVIADDTPLLREGLARLLTEAGVEVCGVAGDGDELVRIVERELPDVALIDIRMPPTHSDEGLIAAAQIRARTPGVGVLVLSQYVEASYAIRLLDSQESRSGYLIKDRVKDTRELLAAIDRVAAGETVIDRELVDALLQRPRCDEPLATLTPREREVLALLAEGLTDKAIAERLWLTPKTVETHVRHILRKLELPTGAASNRRVQAVLAYLRSA